MCFTTAQSSLWAADLALLLILLDRVERFLGCKLKLLAGPLGDLTNEVQRAGRLFGRRVYLK